MNANIRKSVQLAIDAFSNHCTDIRCTSFNTIFTLIIFRRETWAAKIIHELHWLFSVEVTLRFHSNTIFYECFMIHHKIDHWCSFINLKCSIDDDLLDNRLNEIAFLIMWQMSMIKRTNSFGRPLCYPFRIGFTFICVSVTVFDA